MRFRQFVPINRGVRLVALRVPTLNRQLKHRGLSFDIEMPPTPSNCLATTLFTT